MPRLYHNKQGFFNDHPHDDHYYTKDPLLLHNKERNLNNDINLEHNLDDLENGVVKNLFVSKNNICRRISGSILMILSIIGFVLMGINANHDSICPETFSVLVCFGSYALLVIFFLSGLFIAFGLIALFAGCYCCELCSQCGQLFACCLMIGEM